MTSDLAFSALAMGLLASLHCAGMCGPIAVAGATRGGAVSAAAASSYAAGRLLGYAMVGALLGQLGRHVLCFVRFDRVELVAVVVVAAASAARGVALLRGRAPSEPLVTLSRSRQPPSPGARVLAALAPLWPKRGVALGLATAVMPCGVLVPAWALAASAASAAGGALAMALFALASLPGLALPIAGHGLLARALPRLPAAAYGVAWCAFAIWTAARPVWVAAHCAAP